MPIREPGGLLPRGKNHKYTVYPPKFAYNFKGFSDPLEVKKNKMSITQAIEQLFKKHIIF